VPDANDPTHPRRELVGRFQLIGTFHEGASTLLHLVRDSGSVKVLVAKELKPAAAADPILRRRFIDQAQASRRYQHGQLAVVLDIQTADRCPFVVMEYYPRGSLTDRLKTMARPLRVDEGLTLANGLAIALTEMHQSGVGHGNLNPDNCLFHLPTSDHVVVSDRLSNQTIRDPLPLPDADPHEEILLRDELVVLTNPGFRDDPAAQPETTQGYLAPEMWSNFNGDKGPHNDRRTGPASDTKVDLFDAPNPRTLRWDVPNPTADVYSASAIVLAAIGGAPPLLRPTTGQPPFLSTAFALAGPLAPGLRRGLSLRPTDRQPTITVWLDELAHGLIDDNDHAPERPASAVDSPLDNNPAPDAPSRPRRNPVAGNTPLTSDPVGEVSESEPDTTLRPLIPPAPPEGRNDDRTIALGLAILIVAMSGVVTWALVSALRF